MTRSTSMRNLLATTTNKSSSQPVAPPPEPVALESDFVVILAALLCALICMVGLIAVARCAWLRRGAGGTSSSASHSSANKGLKKKVLQALPKFTYSATEAKTKYASECSICLGDFAEGDEIRVLPQCGHCFHSGCIDTWLASHSSCPSCRQILVVATRCQKCGQFPNSGAGAGCAETELKAREENSSSSSSNHSGFLP